MYTLQRGVVTRQPLRGGCQELFQCFNLDPSSTWINKGNRAPEVRFPKATFLRQLWSAPDPLSVNLSVNLRV